MNKGMNMNYRTDILDMVRRKTAQDYQLPADSLLLYKATEVMAENWFAGDFEYACGMDAQDAAGDSSLTHLVMVKYFELEQEDNRVGDCISF
jgi:hypothetical protein